ncbi:MAG: tRNA uridine-5-carboxymethylaminomethyl(34) synthesis GTPase MnmE [Legionellales bacterium]|jgi:tRNA modification GTPase|nr:tRNA uridine-5-carboxymethylaminomethyl(34) synthesis GTPase MnmE [Legionellales bacterium]
MSIVEKTIIAPATPSGRGGVAVVRVSGPKTKQIQVKLIKKQCKPRYATYAYFHDAGGEVIDSGLCLFFEGPASYTGEDVLELHCHGSPTVVNLIIKAALEFGAELAGPGEFTQRAFLNGKLDLFQAEAVASIIEADSEIAVKSANRSLQGVFSSEINFQVKKLTELRVYIEAGLDFVEEDIDFMPQGEVFSKLTNIIADLAKLTQRTKLGKVLGEGVKVVLSGPTNAGKSSLFNKLTGDDDAIVAQEEGTTRDVIRQKVKLGPLGATIELLDTAGIRETSGVVELAGIAKSKQHVADSDVTIVILSAESYKEGGFAFFVNNMLKINALSDNIVFVLNKCDVWDKVRSEELERHSHGVYLSAKTGEGVAKLRDLVEAVCFDSSSDNENIFTARTRHVNSLSRATNQAIGGLDVIKQGGAIELLAEHLRLAQDSLGEITGEVSSDDLLGEIFGSFCIGK